MTSVTMTIRLEDKVKNRLAKLASMTERTQSFLAAQAINEYLKIQEWQISEIKKGIAEANAGQLIEHNSILQHWEKKRAYSLDKKR